MDNATRLHLTACLGLLAVLAAGCQTARTQPVTGKVVFKDGAPLTGGWVMLEPVDRSKTQGARGEIQKDGSFCLGTYEAADGAIEGAHRVAILPPPPPVGANPKASLIHPRFQSVNTSNLECTVSKGKNHFVFEVDRP
jgi:hypothetical protein